MSLVVIQSMSSSFSAVWSRCQPESARRHSRFVRVVRVELPGDSGGKRSPTPAKWYSPDAPHPVFSQPNLGLAILPLPWAKDLEERETLFPQPAKVDAS